MIAAVSRDGGIGRGGDMLWHLREDLRRFKALTTGHAVVMGRKTFESLPGGALPGRRNIVVSRQPGLRLAGAEVYASLPAALAAAAAGPSPVYVIGGGQIYAQAMPQATTLCLTEVDADDAGADTYFPHIDPAQWQLAQQSDWLRDERSGRRYRFADYCRKQ